MKRLFVIVIAGLVGGTIAIAQDETPSTDPVEGLEKAKSAFAETWVNPNADITKFDNIYPWEAHFEYRDVGPAQRTRGTMLSTHKREFGISDEGRAEFERVVTEAFVDELQKIKRFEIADQPGPRTLLLRGAFLDIISRVPPDTMGASDIYLSSIGEATLVLELIDAENGETFALVAERRAIQPPGGGQIDSFSSPTNRVTIIADVKRWARRAASKLRSELDKAKKKAG